MPVSFDRIPSNIRVPLFYAEVSNQFGSYYYQDQPSVLIGPMLDTAVAEPNTPILITGYAEAIDTFGEGSILADMVQCYRANDTFGELWCVGVDPGTHTAATATLTFVGTVAVAGMVSLWIGGDLVRTVVPRDADQDDVAEAVADAINASVGGLVTALAAGGVVTLTARQGGVLSNDIGIYEAEAVPLGIGLSTTAMTGGAGVPDLADAFDSLGDESYDFVGICWSDIASLNAAEDAFNDVAGRWAWDRQSYGHCFAARMGTTADLVTFGRTRNDPHFTLVGYAPSTTPSWRVCAAWVAQAASSLRIDPARPLQTLRLNGINPPARGAVFTKTQLQSLLNSGIAPANPVPPLQEMQIIRSITTYQRNRWGQPDPSWLDIQTPFTLAYFIRFLRGRILQKFPRHKLANDGAVIGPGHAVATPRIIRAELLAAYDELARSGLVEDVDGFDRLLIVERNANDPNRVDVLASPDLVNQLRILALLVAFRLQATTLPGGTGISPFIQPMVASTAQLRAAIPPIDAAEQARLGRQRQAVNNHRRGPPTPRAQPQPPQPTA